MGYCVGYWYLLKEDCINHPYFLGNVILSVM